ncbi:MAG: DUF3800 domain-containing protein [Acidobacteriota bacterium]
MDESGDHTLQLADNDNHRYLGLLGLWFETGDPYRGFAGELEALKEEIFGPHPDDDPICLHRKDIVERRGIFGRLRDRDLNARFELGLIDLVSRARFNLACVVLDKLEHGDRLLRERSHPYHDCLAALLERYAGWLDSQELKGDVIAESRGSKEDQQLQQEFRRTLENGTRFLPPEIFRSTLTSTKIKLKKKEHAVAGLQLADLLAYPFKREIVAHRRGAEAPKDFSAAVLNAARAQILEGGVVWLE